MQQNEMHADDMDDFCKTAWHLIELAEKDKGSPRARRQAASRLRSDPDLILCEHAAQTEKHGKSRPDVASKAGLREVEITEGWNTGGFGKGSYGKGEQGIKFKFENGVERDAFEFAAAVLQKWEMVFALE